MQKTKVTMPLPTPKKRHPAHAEYRRLTRWATPLQGRIWGFLSRGLDLEPTFTSFKGDLVHGTPTEGLNQMVEEGFCPQSHSILSGEWLCVSPNTDMLLYFGETDRAYNGFHAPQCNLPNLLRLEDLHLDFLQAIAEDDGNLDSPEWARAAALPRNQRLVDWMRRSKIIGPENAIDPELDHYAGMLWRNFPSHIHGLMWPNLHRNLYGGDYIADGPKSEAELSLTPSGAELFEKTVKTVFLKNEEIPIEAYRERLEKQSLIAA